jgi:hypothetical protein
MNAMLRVLLDRVDSISDLVAGLYSVGINSYGQRGNGETCAALLDLADRVEEWRDRA